ncbi:trypsin-like cysteine/serine peptidase domain-containing protein [Aspergillus pseudonomiae]|uniref:Trypsin-like cysteine/serine peptidase domain-containing protein n=1 Tax=Aspergillus pseudonomiae TaxID=1506151 RepID=A0A5N7DA34_9EURO|nr:trypsin-like cysteine/serine peptidase domain-containing protein [Aspergillus pseudonomiae]KAE8403251.1 trypsin-like cysteine/serine peptidase domain-containing protein [Aspergillus pseudonomiae]
MKPMRSVGRLLFFISFIALPVNAIIGGSDASPDSAPFAVALISSTLFGDTYLCAGSLISPKTVLTTAGCVDGSSASSLKIRVGSLEHATGGKLNQVIKVIKHPNYNTNTRDSDFAVLHLTSSVTDIEPVAIAKQSTLTGAPVTLYGWGKTDKLSNKNPRTLQQLQTTFISFDDCDKPWSDLYLLTHNMNCDAAPETKQGSCSQDQGGPVVDESGELVGIIGHYNYCEPSSNGRPDVNNDALSANSWIAQNTI